MPTTRIVIPMKRGCGTKRGFPTDYYSNLSNYCTPEEFSSSINRINAAFQTPAILVLGIVASFICYLVGLFFLVSGTEILVVGSDLILLFGGLAAYIILCIYKRNSMVTRVSAALQEEHLRYSTRRPQLAWRLANASYWSTPSLELDLLGGDSTVPNHNITIAQATPVYAAAVPPPPVAYHSPPIQYSQHQLPVYPQMNPYATTGSINSYPSDVMSFNPPRQQLNQSLIH